jgi:multiple sugar transport system substrate-binding protein
MKKLLSIVLVLMLALSAVGASAETVVRFWTHQNLAWNASYEALIADFEAAYPDIKIEYTNFPYDDFEAKIQTSLIAGDVGADVYEVWGGWMLDFVDAGALYETPEKFVAQLKQDTFAPVLGTLEKDGKYYGAPVELNVEYGGLLVNKKLFEENGIAYPKTWAEVLETAKKVAVQNGETMEMRGLEFGQRDNLCANWLSMILQKGGRYLTDDGKVDFNTPEAISAMQELVDYIAVDHITNLDSTTVSQGYDGHSFVGLDEAYMVTRGPWVISDCIESYGMVFGENLDYIPQPVFYEGAQQKWVAETGWSLCVPKNTKVADAAWTFIVFILQPENLIRHNIACAQIPPRASVAEDPAYLEQMPYMAPLMSILPNAEFIGPFNTDIFKTYLTQMFTSLVSNDGTYASVEEACKKLTADLEANMKMY